MDDKKAPSKRRSFCLLFYYSRQLLLIIKNCITGLPAFKLAIAPGSINPKSNSSQKHNDQPLKKEPQPGAVETQPPAFNVGISTDPALLR